MGPKITNRSCREGNHCPKRPQGGKHTAQEIKSFPSVIVLTSRLQQFSHHGTVSCESGATLKPLPRLLSTCFIEESTQALTQKPADSLLAAYALQVGRAGRSIWQPIHRTVSGTCDPGTLALVPQFRVSSSPPASASPAPALVVFHGHVPPTYDVVGTHHPAIALSLSSLFSTGHPPKPTQTHRRRGLRAEVLLLSVEGVKTGKEGWELGESSRQPELIPSRTVHPPFWSCPCCSGQWGQGSGHSQSCWHQCNQLASLLPGPGLLSQRDLGSRQPQGGEACKGKDNPAAFKRR